MMFNPKIEKVLDNLVQTQGIRKSAFKIALFCIDQSIPFPSLITNPRSVLTILSISGLINRDYDLNKTLTLTEPLYVSMEESEEPVSDINKSNVQEFVENHAHELREIFGKYRGEKLEGLRSGSLGDEHMLKKKLVKWFKRTKFKYSWEDVLNTAQKYVDQERDNNNYRYLQACDYFVLKSDRSRLSSMIDEGKNYNSTQANSDAFSKTV